MSDQSEKTELNRIPDEKGRMVFPPGVSGNPAGRPKGSFSLVEMIKNKLQEQAKDKDKTYAEYFIDQLIKKTVVDGDVTMMRDILNRVDGMPQQKVDMTTQGEKIQSGVIVLPQRNGNPLESSKETDSSPSEN